MNFFSVLFLVLFLSRLQILKINIIDNRGGKIIINSFCNFKFDITFCYRFVTDLLQICYKNNILDCCNFLTNQLQFLIFIKLFHDED